MKAVVLTQHGPGEKAFSIQEVKDVFPQTGEIKIKVKAFGLNFADVMARNGLYRAAPPLPSILGYEVAGEIVEIGDQVVGFKVGDLVIANTRFGGYAEYAVANQYTAVKVQTLDHVGKLLALPTQYTTALMCVEEAIKVRKGETVLIHSAAGGVGGAMVDLLKDKGVTIIGTAGSHEKLDFIKTKGVDIAVSYQNEKFWDEIKKVHSKGIDVIFDAVGGKVYKEGFKQLNVGGRIVVYGAAYRTKTKPGKLAMIKMLLQFGFTHPLFLMMKSKTISGVNMLEIGENRTDILHDLLNRSVQLYEKGTIDPVVGGIFSVNDIGKIHQNMENRKYMGKVSIEW